MTPSILVCVTFHYVAARLVWLRQVVECFSAYGHPVRLIVLTNTDDPAERASIETCMASSGAMRTECRSFTDLPDPFELTWSHKSIVAKEFVGGRESHFIYVEDDILISAEAFAYWVENRALLARRGLIPGFLRIEYERSSGIAFATDQFRPTQLDRMRMVRFDQWTFTNTDNPYTASFILDRDLAAEYVTTRSFDMTESLAVKSNWGIRERAAMGLCFENVPRFFWSRLVVPFDRATLRVPNFARIVHAPANYANDPASDLATIPADSIFLKANNLLFVRERVRTVRRLIGASIALPR